jgi:hypothetical protein
LGGAPAARSSASAFASAAATAMTSIRFAACSSTSSRLARLKKLEPLRCGSGCGLCAEEGARGAPPGGRGASIILGGGDPRRPEMFFLIDPRFGQKYWFLDPRRPKIII